MLGLLLALYAVVFVVHASLLCSVVYISRYPWRRFPSAEDCRELLLSLFLSALWPLVWLGLIRDYFRGLTEE